MCSSSSLRRSYIFFAHRTLCSPTRCERAPGSVKSLPSTRHSHPLVSSLSHICIVRRAYRGLPSLSHRDIEQTSCGVWTPATGNTNEVPTLQIIVLRLQDEKEYFPTMILNFLIVIYPPYALYLICITEHYISLRMSSQSIGRHKRRNG